MGPKSECQPKLTEVDGHSNTAVFRSIPARVVGGAHRLSGADLRPPRPVRVAHCRVHPMRNGRRQLRKCVAFKSVNNGISSQSMMAFRTCIVPRGNSSPFLARQSCSIAASATE